MAQDFKSGKRKALRYQRAQFRSLRRIGPLLAAGERTHFDFGANDKETFLKKLGPLIKAYAREGIRKPLEVTHALNRAGVRTARGEKWSPRLTSFLLEMVFEVRGRRGKGIWEQPSIAQLLRPGFRNEPNSKKRKTLGETEAPPNVASLSALPNPLHQESVSRKARHLGEKLGAARVLRQPKLLGVALKIIPKLPSMAIPDTIGIWRNALADSQKLDGKYPRHELRELIDAIGQEWDRRSLRASSLEAYFKWPSTDAEPGTGYLHTVDWPTEGLLKLMGYSVGRGEGQAPHVRRAILAEVFSSHLPPLISPEYMKEWASPSSAARLQKMAESIASFTRNARRRSDDAMSDAIKNWEQDLRFLYEKYYVNHFHFAWPTTTL